MGDTPAESPRDAVSTDGTAQRKSISMHDGVPVWYDCCSCEAEPYWAAMAEETGNAADPGQDDTDAS